MLLLPLEEKRAYPIWVHVFLFQKLLKKKEQTQTLELKWFVLRSLFKIHFYCYILDIWNGIIHPVKCEPIHNISFFPLPRFQPFFPLYKNCFHFFLLFYFFFYFLPYPPLFPSCHSYVNVFFPFLNICYTFWYFFTPAVSHTRETMWYLNMCVQFVPSEYVLKIHSCTLKCIVFILLYGRVVLHIFCLF